MQPCLPPFALSKNRTAFYLRGDVSGPAGGPVRRRVTRNIPTLVSAVLVDGGPPEPFLQDIVVHDDAGVQKDVAPFVPVAIMVALGVAADRVPRGDRLRIGGRAHVV